jgi:hypothetical protein
MTEEKIPEKMQAVYDEIIELTDTVCKQHLNSEYADLSRGIAAKLSRKRPSPLVNGRTKTWAAGILYALGQMNFLFDKSQTPHLSADKLCALFDVSQNSASAKAKLIRDTFRMNQLDQKWTLPSRVNDNPLTWMVMVNGYIVDIRQLPRSVQKEAYRKGIIPYIPGDSPTREK